MPHSHLGRSACASLPEQQIRRVRPWTASASRSERGTVFGLLGPNGAGKSTTVKILSTLARPDSGTPTVAGIDVAADPAAVRRAIGLVSQRPSCDPMATGRENLVLAARIQGLSRRDAGSRQHELLDRFGIADAADRRVKTWSGGMSRKLDVAIGLVHRPSVLFLDEPTTGLDPEARAEMWAEIGGLAGRERITVLLTTHYLDEADRLATASPSSTPAGSVTQGTPEELKAGCRATPSRRAGRRLDDRDRTCFRSWALWPG